jgi:site-specific recombinase XerD
MGAKASKASVRAKSASNRGRRFPAQPLTDAEVRKLLDAITGNGPLAVRNRAVIVLIYRSGLRISEALSLRPADLANGQINVRRGKGAKQRVAYYDDTATPYLNHWLGVRASLGVKARAPLFCSVSRGEVRKAGEAIDPSYFRHLLPRLAVKAGIEKRLHAHGLRHTYATELERERLRIGSISGLLGHSKSSTTDAYLRRISGGELRDDLAAIGRTFTTDAA